MFYLAGLIIVACTMIYTSGDNNEVDATRNVPVNATVNKNEDVL